MNGRTKVASKARLESRLTVEQKQLFERAAVLAGYGSLSDFVIQTVQKRAKRIIKENEEVIASKKDSEIFFNALLNPKKPSKTLRDAAKKYKLAK